MGSQEHGIRLMLKATTDKVKVAEGKMVDSTKPRQLQAYNPQTRRATDPEVKLVSQSGSKDR